MIKSVVGEERRENVKQRDVLAVFFSLLFRAQCLKITEKVAFNIASEASYVYNLSGQKLLENGPFW